MAQYLLSVHYVDDQPATPVEEMEKAFKQVDELNQELMASGQWVFGGGLHEPAEHSLELLVDRHVGIAHPGADDRPVMIAAGVEEIVEIDCLVRAVKIADAKMNDAGAKVRASIFRSRNACGQTRERRRTRNQGTATPQTPADKPAATVFTTGGDDHDPLNAKL